MSNPPPGYSSTDSLLQGGTSEITPLMGGGNTVMTDMHESLLKGGESVEIMPLKGGGGAMVIAQVVSTHPGKAKTIRNKVLGSQRLYKAKVVEVMPEEIPWVGGGADPIEIKNVDVPSDEKVSLNPDTLKAMVQTEYPNLLKDYLKNNLSKWKRDSSENAKIITRDTCSIPSSGPVDEKGVAGFDRVSHILPATTRKIILVSPINGDLQKFLHILPHIEKYNHEPETVFIFAPPFFKMISNNKELFTAYLKVRSISKSAMFLLCMNTIPNRIIGCGLDKKTVVTMVEPSYIVYPFERTVGGNPVDGIVFSGAAVNEVDVPATTGNSTTTSSFIAIPGNKGWIAFPPDIANKDTGFDAYQIYRFTGNNAYKITSDVVEFIVQKPVSVPKENPFIKGKFMATDASKLMAGRVEVERVPLDGEIYSVRKPGLVPVTKDWIDMKFTVDEAAMLNALNLRPEFLQEIFSEDSIPWNQQLANFMDNMVTSKCFLEPSLLINSKCDASTRFINRVFQYFLENDTAFSIMKQEKDKLLLEQGELEVDKWKLDTSRQKADDMAKINTLSTRLKDQEARSNEMGVDLGRSISDLLKNPFTDKRIRVVAMGIFRPLLTYINRNNLWAKEIMAVNLKDNKFSKAELSIPDGKNNEDALKKLDIAFKKLQEDYPGWKFIAS